MPGTNSLALTRFRQAAGGVLCGLGLSLAAAQRSS